MHDEWFADEERVRKAVGFLENPAVEYPNTKEVSICLDGRGSAPCLGLKIKQFDFLKSGHDDLAFFSFGALHVWE